MINRIFGGRNNKKVFYARDFHRRKRLNKKATLANRSNSSVVPCFLSLCFLLFKVYMQIDALLFEKIQIQDSESHLESYGLYVGNRSRETLKIFKAKTSQERRTLTYSKKTFRQLQGKLKRCQIGDCPRNNPILIRNDIPENRFFCGRK
jgi:hypothetical protein